MERRLPGVFSHPVSLIGLVIAVFNAGLIVFLSVVEVFSRRAHPYADLIIWPMLPVLVLLGLCLIVIGIRSLSHGLSRHFDRLIRRTGKDVVNVREDI